MICVNCRLPRRCDNSPHRTEEFPCTIRSRFLPLFLAGVLVSRAEFAVDLEKGKEIKGTCAVCHGETGKGRGMFPMLVGQYTNYLKRQVDLYRKGDRPHGEEGTVGVVNGRGSGYPGLSHLDSGAVGMSMPPLAGCGLLILTSIVPPMPPSTATGCRTPGRYASTSESATSRCRTTTTAKRGGR
ncbi:MAG: c-type cytochrome [Candidatus Dechloromonas phosphoritropha]